MNSTDRANTLRDQIARLVEEYAGLALPPQPFEPGSTRVPPSGRLIGAEELKLMVEASLDGWLTTGQFKERFERKLAQFIGVKHAITVNSGSSANLVAFSTLTSPQLGERAIRPGDAVIGVAAGFPTTLNPILQFGAVPVFVDVEIGAYNVDAGRVEEAISPRTRAVMLGHTLGNPYNLELVTALSRKHGVRLVEDCCGALGPICPAQSIAMSESSAAFTDEDVLKHAVESSWNSGRRYHCLIGRDDTCGKRFRLRLADLPRGYDHKCTFSDLGCDLRITDSQRKIH